MLVFAYLILAFVTVGFYLARHGKRTKNGIQLPPGPSGLPLLGNVHQIVNKAPLKFSKWAQQYGKMYTIYLGGNTPALVVNDVPLMKQIFGTMASTGRQWNLWFDLLFEGNHGLFNTDGKTWQEQRHFLATTLKDFGFGSRVSSHLESMMLVEIDKLSDCMEKEMGIKGATYLCDSMKECSGGTLWAIVTGSRITPEKVHMVEAIIQTTQKLVNTGLLFIPWIKYIAPQWSGYTEAKEVARKFHLLIEESYREHKADPNKYTHKDIISAAVEHWENMKDNPNSVFFGAVGEFHNIKTLISFLVAGVETTSTTLNWLFFYLCVHADVQKKLQEEIDEKIGHGGDPNLSDKEKMPYAEAVILETLRLSRVVPFGVIHELTDDITIQGQKFPKGLSLIANTFHVHHDTSIWGDPDNFRPERFLEKAVDDRGSPRIIGKLRDSVVSFQPGRRTCIGEPLARDVIFMFMVKLCQTFSFLPVEGKTKEEYMERQFGLLILPNNLGIRVERRK